MDPEGSLKRKFVSQEEIDEARRKRQEEWKIVMEKTGKEAPKEEEEVYDPRTLYERLQEQKMKKEEALQEMTRFSNLIHRLDEDEIEFLATLESQERKNEKVKLKKEEELLEEFRRAAAEADEAAYSTVSVITGSAPHVKQHPDKPKVIKHDAQKDILKNAVKRRSVMIRKKASGDSETGSNHLDKKIKIEDMGNKNEGDGDCTKNNGEKRKDVGGENKKGSENKDSNADITKKTEREDKSGDASTEQITPSVANPLASLLGYGEDSDDDSE
ncbi:1469_t:CDS:2 [Paraglomus occultum]|uniref:1469_t:CDS:1 n=1 Tax=Paraglomus occultum TaxID=144539 RepID=A0A9N8VVX0_9GLOM|nr:1469_t:CDS:2 [Paraglomus occultum]